MQELTRKRKKFSDSSEQKRSLILYNDDMNHFDFVMESLIDVCEHTPEQAEQCTLIAHFNGSCEIKYGSDKDLIPCHKRLSERKIIVCIE